MNLLRASRLKDVYCSCACVFFGRVGSYIILRFPHLFCAPSRLTLIFHTNTTIRMPKRRSTSSARSSAATCPRGTVCVSPQSVALWVAVAVIVGLCLCIGWMLYRGASPSRAVALGADSTATVPHYVDSSKIHDDPTHPPHRYHRSHRPHRPHRSPRIRPESKHFASPTTKAPEESSRVHTNEALEPTAIASATTIVQTSPTVLTTYDTMLQPPLRRAPNTVAVGMMPINIETRGRTPEMQQVGILSNGENDKVLALYGRPTYRGSSKWIYYTGSDKFHSVKLPVEKNKRDCTGEYGCDELYDNDEVRVKGYSGAFRVTVYGLDAPRYIPYVV